MISFILLALAAVLDSINDTLAYGFSRSVFKSLNPNWWNPMVSWMHVKLVLGYRLDGWHMVKSIKIIMIVMSIIVYKPVFGWFWDGVILSVIWNAVFSLFWDIILRRKP